MQQFCQKIILDHFFYQKAYILIAYASKIMNIHQNWKIGLNLGACYQEILLPKTEYGKFLC